MGRFSFGSPGTFTRLRRGLTLGLGAALLATGATLVGIGLISYFDDGVSTPETSSVSDQSLSIEDVPNLPVAIPYNNPQRTAPAPEAPAVTVPLRLVI
ncbi:MAG: hypothetical protein IIA91_11135, partial [Chloroflexi bacterium]|nr:hypothetical protein [Chloroflexota bacterium]